MPALRTMAADKTSVAVSPRDPLRTSPLTAPLKRRRSRLPQVALPRMAKLGAGTTAEDALVAAVATTAEAAATADAVVVNATAAIEMPLTLAPTTPSVTTRAPGTPTRAPPPASLLTEAEVAVVETVALRATTPRTAATRTHREADAVVAEEARAAVVVVVAATRTVPWTAASSSEVGARMMSQLN